MATRKSTFSPFSTLKIASHEFLRELERQPCPNCCASRKYYCYVCYITVGVDRSLVPTIKLPIKVDIIKHQGELVGKSTATHARILAPEDAVPDFKDETKVIIVFPAKDAVSLKTLSERHKTDLMHTPESAGTDLFDRVVFIDSTWQQCHKIITDEKLVRLQKVKLENAITHFWRPQRNKPDTCLATIEAIYYFFKEYEEHILLREYDGKYDNLLFFFAFQYNLIQEEQAKRLKAGIQQVPNKAQSSLPWGAYYILSELDGQIRHLQMEHISFAELRKLLKTKPVIPPGEGHLVRISCQFGRPDAFHLQAS